LQKRGGRAACGVSAARDRAGGQLLKKKEEQPNKKKGKARGTRLTHCGAATNPSIVGG